jgi:pimeloyl-ACP methyl ester carboxylesterase
VGPLADEEDDVTWREAKLDRVTVDDDELTFGWWGRGDTIVLASHGITANHRSFAQLAWALDERGALDTVTLVAVDHRGRGGSAAHPGPYGIRTHAQDLFAVLDHVGGDRAVIVGHSMGAFIATLAAERAPERVTGLVLVDGALPIEVQLPPDADIEAVVRAVIGPALERLDTTFASPEAYLDHWRAHPAFQGAAWNDVAEAYFRYDLVETDGGWRSPVSKRAVLEDGGGPLQDGEAATALGRISTPTTLLWAPRGLLDQTPGLFPPELVASTTAELAHVTTELVDDTNHYSILFSDAGARRVAAAVLAALEDGSDGSA